MTIYLFSELYPLDENDTSITHAVRDFADAWDAEVIVFRPLQLGIPFLKRLGHYTRLIRHSPVQLGKRAVVFFPLMKVPFIRKYLYRIAKRHELPAPSIMVGHSLMGNYIAKSRANEYGVPFSTALHSYDMANLEKEKKQYEKLLRRSGLIACRSHSIRKQLNEIFGDQFRQKSFVAHSGIEIAQVEEESLFLSKAKALKLKEVRFVTASRLLKLKNIDVNIEILAGVDYDFSYTIIGDGPERKKLQALIDHHKLSDRIKILGWKTREEVLRHFKSTDIFIMVSAPETFGLAYLEAMAKGNIVIGAYGWGIDGIIRHGQNGYLANPGDVQSLANIIHEIINLPVEKREALLKASRECILKMTRQEVADSYLKKLQALI